MSVKIGKNYWIGNSSTNLKGVKLVDNVTVALNSVITKSYRMASLYAIFYNKSHGLQGCIPFLFFFNNFLIKSVSKGNGK